MVSSIQHGLSGFWAHLSYVYVIAGLAVGFIVGMTGVGGGSLMTPILLHFGIAPINAVGTDLLYAAITKSNGVLVHQKKKNVDWSITVRLAYGSIPAAVLTLIVFRLLQSHGPASATNAFITYSLGTALLITSVAILFKQALLDWSHRNDVFLTRMSERQRHVATIVIGFLLGIIVSITSIGAGALGTMALFLVYPLLPTSKLVGTEIAHAVPLTLIAGLGHASAGHVDFMLLGNLLIGSLPGIWLGSHTAGAVPEKVLRPVLAAMLVYAGVKLLLK
ncbi:MAG: sulfite exporter TauE/SafE family protein [Fibrobacteria bacterium]